MNKQELLESAISRFNKYSSDRESGCWVWSGACITPRKKYNDNVVPVLTVSGKTVYGRRFAYENIANKKIGRGKSLVAGCGNKRCVNPDHAIELSTSEIHTIRYDKEFLKNKMEA
jgi:hypothetical protein